MFCREVEFWSRFRHPNILPFWGCWELDEYRLFMIAPWAQNGNSMQYVKMHPMANRRRILLQTAEALSYLHSGLDGPAVVHGDLKADNVLIGINGEALLGDFGLARYVEKLTSATGTPSGLSSHGHVRFSAPELLYPAPGEESRPTPESDVFAFGCFLIQLFTEDLPFAEIKPEPQVITDIVLGKIPNRPRGIAESRGLDDIVWKLAKSCWQYDPGHRPPMSRIASNLRLINRNNPAI
ncbi:hypothetical protein M422DRAFT_165301 [Sphaerobolus stellatus SS14]|nr:hypothetical protein M422DRAFT_165301 [Sphaerobolus stellatus SS14]